MYPRFIHIVGCRQVVRHQVLVLAFGGSNPSIPAMKIVRPFWSGAFHSPGMVGIRAPGFVKQNDEGFGGAQCSEISLLISQTSGGGFSRYPSICLTRAVAKDIPC